jgi:hypothetical protein
MRAHRTLFKLILEIGRKRFGVALLVKGGKEASSDLRVFILVRYQFISMSAAEHPL